MVYWAVQGMWKIYGLSLIDHCKGEPGKSSKQIQDGYLIYLGVAGIDCLFCIFFLFYFIIIIFFKEKGDIVPENFKLKEVNLTCMIKSVLKKSMHSIFFFYHFYFWQTDVSSMVVCFTDPFSLLTTKQIISPATSTRGSRALWFSDWGGTCS